MWAGLIVLPFLSLRVTVIWQHLEAAAVSLYLHPLVCKGCWVVGGVSREGGGSSLCARMRLYLLFFSNLERMGPVL